MWRRNCLFFGLVATRIRRFVNTKTRIYQSASRAENVAQNLAIFSACLQQESVNFCVHFQKSFFFRKTQQESVEFYHHFLVGRSGRVGPGRVGSGRVVLWHVGVALKSKNALRIIHLSLSETVIQNFQSELFNLIYEIMYARRVLTEEGPESELTRQCENYFGFKQK